MAELKTIASITKECLDSLYQHMNVRDLYEGKYVTVIGYQGQYSGTSSCADQYLVSNDKEKGVCFMFPKDGLIQSKYSEFRTLNNEMSVDMAKMLANPKPDPVKSRAIDLLDAEKYRFLKDADHNVLRAAFAFFIHDVSNAKYDIPSLKDNTTTKALNYMKFDVSYAKLMTSLKSAATTELDDQKKIDIEKFKMRLIEAYNAIPKDQLGFRFMHYVLASVFKIHETTGGRRKTSKRTTTYTRTVRKHTAKDGTKRTIYAKGGHDYVKRISKKTGKIRYQKV